MIDIDLSDIEPETPELTPDLLLSWLHQDGWVEIARDGISAIVNLSLDGSAGQVLVPLRLDLVDYDEGVERVINKAAAAIGRPAWLVREEMLAGVARDLVTVGSESVEPGIVPLSVASALFDGARDLLLAGAAAAIERRSAFGSDRPGGADDYLRDVHATVRAGSFDVLLSCPLSTAGPQPRGEPFGRQVTRTLARAMTTAVELAQDQARRDSPGAWVETVADGVSADLLDAVAQLVPADRHGERAVTVEFSPNLRAEVRTRGIVIPPGIADRLAVAAAYLRG